MSTVTSNLQLIKPDATDFYDVSAQNNNMDVIDETIAKHIGDITNPHKVTPEQIGARTKDTLVSIANFLPIVEEETDIRAVMFNVPSGHYAFTPSTNPLLIVPDVSCYDAQVGWEKQVHPNGLIYGKLTYSSMYRDSPTSPEKPAIVYQCSVCNNNCYTAWKKLIDSSDLTNVTDITSAFTGATGVTLSGATFKQRGKTVYFQFTATITQTISATGALVTAPKYYPIVRQVATFRYDTVSTASSSNGITQYECVSGQVLQHGTNTVISSGLQVHAGDVLFVFGSYDVE